MSKKSKIASILNTIFSLIGVGVSGYLAFVVWIVISIALDLGDGSNALSILPLLIVVIPVVLCVVSFIMSCVSYKYIGKDAYYKAKKFMIAFIVIEFIIALFFISFLIVNISQILPVLVCGFFAIIYILCGVLHLVDLIKSINNEKLGAVANDQ